MDKKICAMAIKIRAEQGCFCRSHSPLTNRLIDEIISQEKTHDINYHEHESGPEIIAWLALGTAGLTVTKSLIDLVVAIINACKKGRANGDNHKGKLLLILRDEHRSDSSTEDFILEIYDSDVITTEIIQKSIKTALDRRYGKTGGRKND